MRTSMPGLLLCALALVLSWCLVRLMLVYARRRGLYDHPGRRRMHAAATPRGAGLGVMAAGVPCMVAALLALRPSFEYPQVALLTLAVAIMAAAGWWDDHRSPPIGPRLLAQAVAAALLCLALIPPLRSAGQPLIWLLALWPVLLWSSNLHNFMDGIDGLLGQQMLFFFYALGMLAHLSAQPALGFAAWCVAAANAAFLAFNWPPARIFMGDVGSAALGLLVAGLAALLWSRAPATLWASLILASAFVLDASLTLLWRWRSRRHWYTAHREHLYQWLVRSGWTQAQTGSVYMLWNLLLAAPAAWIAWRWTGLGPVVCISLYALGTGVWVAARRYCLLRMREHPHASA